eukprot:3103334-Pyramimonas_sp.AAC.1
MCSPRPTKVQPSIRATWICARACASRRMHAYSSAALRHVTVMSVYMAGIYNTTLSRSTEHSPEHTRTCVCTA